MPNGDKMQITTLGFLTTFAILIGWFPIESASAQEKIPVLKANSKNLDVREGHDFYQSYWTASPEVKVDVYYTHRFKKENANHFLILISIRFPLLLSPRHIYNFIILLKGKDTCYTQISTIRSSYFKDCHGCTISTDTIPFTLGKDDRVFYIMGKINGSETLKLFL